MSGGTFSKCPDCGRLNIYGARCACVEAPRIDCDCETAGNKQIIGPRCRQRISDAWAACVNRSDR